MNFMFYFYNYVNTVQPVHCTVHSVQYLVWIPGMPDVGDGLCWRFSLDRVYGSLIVALLACCSHH